MLCLRLISGEQYICSVHVITLTVVCVCVCVCVSVSMCQCVSMCVTKSQSDIKGRKFLVKFWLVSKAPDNYATTPTPV